MTTAARPDGIATAGPWDALYGWNSVLLSAVDGLEGCASAWAAWQEETARFLETRLAEDQRAWAALLSSRDAADALRAQQEWALKTVTDYAGAATRIARLATTLCLAGTTPAVQRAATLLA
ncbi:hypothetical protein BH11PSE3_BH11PSE3_49780 [soil metagenome]